MTIRLLSDYGIYHANTIVTLDSATESGLIAAGLASATLTGGVAYAPPVVSASPPQYADELSIATRRTAFGLNVSRSGPGAFREAGYQRWRAAVERVRSNTGNAKVAFISDSTGSGAYALAGTGSAANTGCRAVCSTAWTIASLNSIGLPAIDGAFFGDQNTTNEAGSGAVALYDTRITLGTNWTDTGSNLKVAGGSALQNAVAADTNPLSFKPFEFVDTYDIYFAQSSSTPAFQATRTGDVTTAFTPGTSFPAVEGAGVVTYKGTTLGPINTQALQISKTGATGTLYVAGVDAYSSASSAVRCFNVGWNSGYLANWIDSTRGWSSQNMLKAMKCDLYVLTGAINDWRTAGNGGGAGVATPVSTYQQNLETFVQAMLPIGDILFVAGYPTAQSDTDLATQRQYIAAMYTVAAKYGITLHDFHAKVGSYERANGFTGQYANTVHPLAALYRSRGEADASLLVALAS